ncbi:MAG: glucose-1-phosphate thymidylyltransferase, partial [Gloeomargaritaceae cyanobacterium C42_A2020_066]|nr:glucose-1-phosphate thymidylyltransferase [Gloeomargaritaceae cyanobacterium C42_A2020_066]
QGELQDAQVIGEVVIEPGAQLVRTTVRGPAHIAQGAYLEDSYIGPYTSVGAGCQVLRSEVEYSILLRGAVVQDLPYRLDSSVLGQDVRVEGGKQGVRRHTLQLVLGDRSQVCL